MSAILFLDPVCQRPYDTRTLATQASGGTEASLTRIADALDAFVMQHNRAEAWGRYLPMQPVAGVAHVIINRDSRALSLARRLFPAARVYLWPRTVSAETVASSRRAWASCNAAGLAGTVPALTIYNPIDEALAPDDTPLDASKLVFFSSPNKGLDFTLDAFAALHERMPDLRLLVGNPGYKADRDTRLRGVEFLGALPQRAMHQQVRGALCTFFPNFVIPETFGLVFAESHALGTPVLTVDCGAALEVLGDRDEVLPLKRSYRIYERAVGSLPPALRRAPARLAARAGLFDAFAGRIQAWRAGARPQVAPDPRFRLGSVVARWRSLLGE